MAHQIELVDYIAVSRGQYERAAVLLGAAEAAWKELNALSDDPQEIRELDVAMTKLGEVHDEDSRDAALAQGGTINLDDAVSLAISEESSD